MKWSGYEIFNNNYQKEDYRGAIIQPAKLLRLTKSL